jgi:hypothetical protein
MKFEPKAFIDKMGLITSMQDALKAAYEQGVQDGIDRIVQAARAPLSIADLGAPTRESATARILDNSIRRRAKRGLLPVVMKQMLSDHPGLTTQQYVDRIGDYDQTVKGNSVGNELRRGDGTRYEKRGRGWFVKNSEIEAEAKPESETSASFYHSNERDQNEATLTSSH